MDSSAHSCFLCAVELENPSAATAAKHDRRKNWSRILCQILHLPHYYGNNIEKVIKTRPGLLLFCDSCITQLSNVQKLLEELEVLEKKILDEKFRIERQLKNSGEFDDGDGDEEEENNLVQELRIGLIEELESASMESLLSKIGGGRVDNRKSDAGGGRNIHIEKINQNTEKNRTFESGNNSQSQKIKIKIAKQQQQSKTKEYKSTKRGRGRPPKLEKSIAITPGTRQSQRRTAKKPNYSLNQESDSDMDDENPSPDGDPLMSDNEAMSMDSFGDAGSAHAADLNFPNDDDGDITEMYQEEEPVDIKYSGTTEFLTINSVTRSESELEDNNLNAPEVRPRVKVKMSGISENARRARERRNPPKDKKDPTEKPPSLKPRRCEECGKLLATRQSWFNHVNSFHKNQFKFKCNICGYGCQYKVGLVTHMTVHTEERPFMCEFCSKCFKLKDKLDAHLKTHSPMLQGMYKCDQCDYTAPRPGDIKRHAVRHTDVRPFHCEICGKTFRRNFHLTKHQVTVHGMPPQATNYFKKNKNPNPPLPISGLSDQDQASSVPVAPEEELELQHPLQY